MIDYLDIQTIQLICPNYKYNKILPLAIRTIKKIQPNLFYFNNFCNVKELYLGGNMISILCNNLFNGLINLRRLFLECNDIIEIEPYAFCHIDNLVELHLSGNYITQLHPNTFNNLIKLKSLSLNNNYLVQIDGLFDNLPQLYFIDMCNNCLIKPINSDYDIKINYEYNFLPNTKNIIIDKLSNIIDVHCLYDLVRNNTLLRFLFDRGLNKNNFMKLFDMCVYDEKTLLLIKKIQCLINLSYTNNIKINNLWKFDNCKLFNIINTIVKFKLSITRLPTINYDICDNIISYI